VLSAAARVPIERLRATGGHEIRTAMPPGEVVAEVRPGA
jgi:hypothetical protein